MKGKKSYKYFIKPKGKSFYFGLYPNNNNRQPIAISGYYSTYKDAAYGIKQLKTLLDTKKNLFSIELKEKKYYFKLNKNECGLSFFRVLGIAQKSNVPKCINRINENYDAPLKENDEEDLWKVNNLKFFWEECK
ncbi:MAG: hypothetical protein IJM71_03630 [Clostridia bacterium]|nr:hypothetical protein [Clostridia bacterium]